MVLPPGFEKSDLKLLYKLNKALYGLKQALRAWFDRLRGVLLSLNFTTSKCDPSLFMLHTSNNYTLVIVYVDDIIITNTLKSFIQ